MLSQLSLRTPRGPLGSGISTRVGVILPAAIMACAIGLGWLLITKTAGSVSLQQTSQLRATQATDLATLLTRSGSSADDSTVDVTLATPDFFQLTNRTGEEQQLGADRALVFVANENTHYNDLMAKFAPILRVDGRDMYAPSEVRVLADAVHHRTDVVIFGELSPSILQGQHSIEVLLPTNTSGTRDVLWWQTPFDYPASLQGAGALSLGLLLSLAAGLLAAISPCLIQLTAFYLPTLAGVSLGGATTAAPIERKRILGTALVFVLGFTIPYTLGGALIGGMGQIVAASGWLNPTGPIAEGAGVVMIGMALLVARQARAPLVCKVPMPKFTRLGGRGRFVTTFVSGFAIATGCLACFGGAIFGVLLVYAGLLGSWEMGALAMFLFSAGLAVPFIVAALSLSWVLPTVHRLQRFTPAIALVMSAVMLFFGVSMATGNYHVVSGWLFQHLPLG